MESVSAGEGYGDRLAVELARVRDALDDLRRRPIPLDGDTLRHIVTASLAEAAAPPPNLLVTAIRRLDRVDARLESIEAALGGGSALPPGGAGAAPALSRGRGPAAPSPPVYTAPPPDAEAIADALTRRLAGIIASQAPAGPAGPPASVDDLMDAVRPLVPGAARAVLRRAGREPSPQAVEVLQQAAMSALEEAAEALGHHVAPGAAFAAPPELRRLPPPPAALAPAPAATPPPTPPPPPPPPPIDVEALATTIATRVAATVAAEVRPPPTPVEEPPRRPPEPEPPPAPPPVDPHAVAEAVITRLAAQPPPQAVVSPMAMAPLLSAVGNVEAAVARIAEPDTDVVDAVGRLQAGIEALLVALEEDRSHQAEVRQGYTEVVEQLRAELATQKQAAPAHDGADWAATGEDDGEEPSRDDESQAGGRYDTALAGVNRRLDQLLRDLVPLTEADLGASVPNLAAQSQRLERSMGHILTALAAVAEHLQEQSAIWRERFDELTAGRAPAPSSAPEDATVLHRSLEDLAARVDELVAGTAADRQRFQRLGGTIDGLAALLGQVSERLDRLPHSSERWPRVAGPSEGEAGGGDVDLAGDAPNTEPLPFDLPAPEAASPSDRIDAWLDVEDGGGPGGPVGVEVEGQAELPADVWPEPLGEGAVGGEDEMVPAAEGPAQEPATAAIVHEGDDEVASYPWSRTTGGNGEVGEPPPAATEEAEPSAVGGDEAAGASSVASEVEGPAPGDDGAAAPASVAAEQPVGAGGDEHGAEDAEDGEEAEDGDPAAADGRRRRRRRAKRGRRRG